MLNYSDPEYKENEPGLTWLNCLPGRFKFEPTIQILPQSLTLNRWFKFEQAVGSSATQLKFLTSVSKSCFYLFLGFDNEQRKSMHDMARR